MLRDFVYNFDCDLEKNLCQLIRGIRLLECPLIRERELYFISYISLLSSDKKDKGKGLYVGPQ